MLIDQSRKLIRLWSCIQPAHLYTGTQKQNAEDRKARPGEEGRWAATGRFMGEYSARMQDGMRYYWDEPPEVERTLFQQQTGEHSCVYTIPAGEYLTPEGKVEEAKLCQICFEGNSALLRGLGGSDPLEEEVAMRAEYRRSVEEFFSGRGPGDPPLDTVPG